MKSALKGYWFICSLRMEKCLEKKEWKPSCFWWSSLVSICKSKTSRPIMKHYFSAKTDLVNTSCFENFSPHETARHQMILGMCFFMVIEFKNICNYLLECNKWCFQTSTVQQFSKKIDNTLIYLMLSVYDTFISNNNNVYFTRIEPPTV